MSKSSALGITKVFLCTLECLWMFPVIRYVVNVLGICDFDPDYLFFLTNSTKLTP